MRFSTGKQLKGSSLERQQSMVQPWLDADLKYEYSDLIFKELGVSDYKQERGYLKRVSTKG
ncbi:hypothetical protein [Pseudomonas chlororaphis]